MRNAMTQRAAEYVKQHSSCGQRKEQDTNAPLFRPFVDVTGLLSVPLGFLRKDAARTVAVCRYSISSRDLAAKAGRARQSGSAGHLPLGFVPDVLPQRDVREISVHKALLDPLLGAIENEGEWDAYCRFLLYHENLHALGFFRHGAAFRALEALWWERNEAREVVVVDGGREKGEGEGGQSGELAHTTSPPLIAQRFAERLGPGRWLWECRGRCCGTVYIR